MSMVKPSKRSRYGLAASRARGFLSKARQSKVRQKNLLDELMKGLKGISKNKTYRRVMYGEG